MMNIKFKLYSGWMNYIDAEYIEKCDIPDQCENSTDKYRSMVNAAYWQVAALVIGTADCWPSHWLQYSKGGCNFLTGWPG